jgi:hypothetical protein
MRSAFLGTSESRGTAFRLMYDQTGAAFFYVSVKIRDTLRGFHTRFHDSDPYLFQLMRVFSPDKSGYLVRSMPDGSGIALFMGAEKSGYSISVLCIIRSVIPLFYVCAKIRDIEYHSILDQIGHSPI